MDKSIIQPVLTAAHLTLSTLAMAVAEERTNRSEDKPIVLIDLKKIESVAKGDRFAYFEKCFGKPIRSVDGDVEADDFAEHYGPSRTYKVSSTQSIYVPTTLTVTAGTWDTSRIHSIRYGITVPDDVSGKQVAQSIKNSLRLARIEIKDTFFKDTKELERTIGENSRGFRLSNDDWVVSIRRQKENVGSGKVRVKVWISPPMRKR